MGEAARTLETEGMEAYLPRTAFYVIGGNATAERFHALRRKVNDGRGPQFWGVRGLKPYENPTTKRTDTLQNRLIDMQHLLRTVPDAPDESPEAVASLKEWAFKPTDALIKEAERRKRSRIINPSTGKRLPLTYHDAHNTPEIRHPAVESLLFSGEPTIQVIRCLEEWRKSNERYYPLNDEQKELGWQSFEIFLFSAGAEQFTRALGSAAISHLQTHS